MTTLCMLGRVGIANHAMRVLRAMTAFRRNKSGVTAMEFGLIAPILVMIVFMIVETSVYFYKQSHLKFVLHDAGRKIQTGEIQSSGTPKADFDAEVCGNAEVIFECSKVFLDVRSFTTLADVVFPSASFNSSGVPSNFVFQPGGSAEITAMRASATHVFITPFLKSIFQPTGDPVILVGFTIFKNEPF